MNRVMVGLIGTLVALAAQTHGGLALEVSRSRDIPAPADAVWALIGDFCAIQRWHPIVEHCILSNASGAGGKTASVRSLVAAGGLGTIMEIETGRDEKAMSYSYAFIEGPLPVKTYRSTITVRPNGAFSTVLWTASFDAAGMSDAEAMADIEGVYDQGLTGIAKEAAR